MPELESTRVPDQTLAASSISINALPVSLSNQGTVVAELPSDAARGLAEVHAESDIPKMEERALRMEDRGEYAAAEEMHR